MPPAKGQTMGPLPKPDDASRAWFEAMVPDHPAVTLRPMFGNPSAFVNGNLFMGLFGPRLFVRLPEEDAGELMKIGGGSFEPMPGRPMRGYVFVPDAWRKKPERVRDWVGRSLDFAETLPPKQPKPKATKKR